MKNQKTIKTGKKVLEGVVVSAKNSKTVIVSVTAIRRHPVYKKPVKRTNRYAVHNENDSIKVGDRVKIVEVRPLSKTKHFKVSEKI